MKFLKWLAIVIVSLFLLVTIIGLFQPEDMHCERTKVISAPPAEVFAVVNNTKQFKMWSPWHKKDTNTAYVYSGPDAGKGAKFTWKSSNGEVGYGIWEIVNAVPNERVDIQFTYEDYPPTPAGYILKPVGTDKTEVTWFMDGAKATNPWSKFRGMLMKYFVGKDYEQGLEDLDAYMKTKPVVPGAAPAVAGRVEKVGVEDFKGGYVLGIRGVTSASEIGATLGQRYAEIGMYMKTKNLTMAGAPCAMYHTWDGKSTDMEACIWIDKSDKGSGHIMGMTAPAGKVVVADYYGPYMGSVAAHNAIADWAKQNNIVLMASPWEEYVTDPMVEKDPMKVHTRVYYRIVTEKAHS